MALIQDSFNQHLLWFGLSFFARNK